MKQFLRHSLTTIIFSMLFAAAIFAQDDAAKSEMMNKISKLSQSKKQDDKAKAYQMTREFLAKYGNDKDDNTAKLKKYFQGYRLSEFDKAVNDNRMADALVIGKEVLAENPNDFYVMMKLAYGGYDVLSKKQDKTYIKDSIGYANQTLAEFDKGNYPKDFAPYKNKDEATAVMHFTIAKLSADSDPKLSVTEFYKSLQYDSEIKKNGISYASIAQYFEQSYQKAAAEYQTKFGAATSESPELLAAQNNLEKILDRMLDAHARAIAAARINDPKSPNLPVWENRLKEIYNFRFHKTDGVDEFITKTTAAPIADPNVL